MKTTTKITTSMEPTGAVPAEFRTVPRAELYESPLNPRTLYDPATLAELAASIRASGIHVPLLVRHNPNGKGQYEIGAGHRRFRAAALAGLEELPVLVRPLNDTAFLELLVLENGQRTDVHPLEEAHGYRQLMMAAGYDVAKIAARVGRSVQYVYDRLRFLQLTKAAQQLFLGGRFTPAHATLISRCTAAQQAEIIQADEINLYGPSSSPLWRDRGGHDLFADEAKKGRKEDPYDGLQPKSVAELKYWIDEHVRFDPTAQDVPVLFPETAVAVQHAAEAELKVVKITHDYQLRPEARMVSIDQAPKRLITCDETERTYGPLSWKKAEKPCPHQALGVVVAGPERGASFLVCVEKKKCDVHWGADRRQAAKRAKQHAGQVASGEDYYARQRAEQARRDGERKRWEKAAPKIRAAIAQRIAALDVKPAGPIAQLVARRIMNRPPAAKTLEDLVRALALDLVDSKLRSAWSASEDWPKLGKRFGVDVRKILEETSPPITAERRPVKKTAAKKGKK